MAEPSTAPYRVVVAFEAAAVRYHTGDVIELTAAEYRQWRDRFEPVCLTRRPADHFDQASPEELTRMQQQIARRERNRRRRFPRMRRW